MNEFLKTYKLVLTPLSPIHIGCGEDFEPTNYVIEDGVLYGFDPSRAVLGDVQKGRLAEVAGKASLLAIQRFFRDNAAAFKPHADVLIPVSPGVKDQYEERVGRTANVEASGNSVFNKLFIERASYTGPKHQPYIPGSSFKGAIRTSWLDELNHEQVPHDVQFRFRDGKKTEAKSTSDMEKRLLRGDFKTSPLRLFKPADLMPAEQTEPARRVLYAVNLKKRLKGRDGHEAQLKGIAARKECILHGQYRAFASNTVLQRLGARSTGKDTPAPDLQPTELRWIAKYSNTYHRTRLERELKVLDGRGMVQPDWKASVEKLLSGKLGHMLETGDAILIRLGRYGGAESKTLSGEGVASIKIMGAKGQPATYESATKTVWLAAERENDQKGLLPFGWAIVEIDPEGDLPELKAWCEQQARGRPDMAALRQRFEAEKADAARLKEALRLQAQERQAAQQAEQAAAAERAQALASLSPQAQEIEKLRQKCEELDKRIAGGNFRRHKYSAGNPGPIHLEATRLVNEALASPEWPSTDKHALADMLETCLPKVLEPWDAKEQRKRLKFASLRQAKP